MIGFVFGVVVVRRHTVVGAIVGLFILLIILALIIVPFVAWLRTKARAETAERELAALKQAYAQLNNAYWQLQHQQPGEASQASPKGPAGPQAPAWPQYPGTAAYPGTPSPPVPPS